MATHGVGGRVAVETTVIIADPVIQDVMQQRRTRVTDSNLEQLRQAISTHYPDSQLEPISDQHLQSLQDTYPNVPAHLVAFYRHIGCGGIGRGRYMIHFATEPNEVYDEQTAADLGNLLIVGDNYAGDCDGYNIDQDWVFGSVNSHGNFVSAGSEFPTIVEWLLYMLAEG